MKKIVLVTTALTCLSLNVFAQERFEVMQMLNIFKGEYTIKNCSSLLGKVNERISVRIFDNSDSDDKAEIRFEIKSLDRWNVFLNGGNTFYKTGRKKLLSYMNQNDWGCNLIYENHKLEMNKIQLSTRQRFYTACLVPKREITNTTRTYQKVNDRLLITYQSDHDKHYCELQMSPTQQ